MELLNAFTTGNPFSGGKLLVISLGIGFRALQGGFTPNFFECHVYYSIRVLFVCLPRSWVCFSSWFLFLGCFRLTQNHTLDVEGMKLCLITYRGQGL